MGEDQQDVPVQSSYTATLAGIPRHIHALRAARLRWRSFFALSVSIFLLIWGLWAALSQSFSITIPSAFDFFAAIGLSLIAGIASTTWRYIRITPAGFETESTTASRLAHLQPQRWQYRLTRELLQNRLVKIDQRISDLLSGLLFVPISRQPDVDEYSVWLRLRPRNLLSMVEVAQKLTVLNLPAAMEPDDTGVISPQNILVSVERIAFIYQQAFEFQLDSYTVEPPNDCANIHSIQQQWITVIQDAIHQLFDFLDQVVEINLTDGRRKIEFDVVFAAPPRMDEFMAELDILANKYSW